jgi:hypothetical protein
MYDCCLVFDNQKLGRFWEEPASLIYERINM